MGEALEDFQEFGQRRVQAATTDGMWPNAVPRTHKDRGGMDHRSLSWYFPAAMEPQQGSPLSLPRALGSLIASLKGR